MKLKTIITSTFLFSLLTTLPAFSAQGITVGYWSDWGIYWLERPYPVSGSRNSSGQTLQNPALDSQLDKLDIVNYAFLEVNSKEGEDKGSLYFYDPWADLSAKDQKFCSSNPTMCQHQDPSWNLGNFQALLDQRKTHPNLKVQISVGGWDHDASFEQGAFINPQKFVESLKALVDYYHIDGIDLDYEPSQSYTAENSTQLVKLAKAIHEALPNLSITLAVFADPGKVKAFDGGAQHNWQNIAQYVRYVNIMGYDMHGSFDNPQITGLQSGLYFDAKEPTNPAYPHFNADNAVKAYLAVGIPAEKLVLGIPSYARFVGGVPATDNGLFQNFSITPDGDLGAPGGMESYYTIMNKWLKSGGFTEYRSYDAKGNLSGVWAYNPSLQQFASYDNTALIDVKAQYVKDQGLAGLMMWELRSDLPAYEDASLLMHMK